MATARSIEGNTGGELAFVDVGRSRAVSPLHESNRRGIAGCGRMGTGAGRVPGALGPTASGPVTGWQPFDVRVRLLASREALEAQRLDGTDVGAWGTGERFWAVGRRAMATMANVLRAFALYLRTV
ncbi:hypothetical protein ColLi_13975 [Colletotrichum liriopes]|uniref:Uncharacterized protein n=1 Tax=Colletotrichum liriopes TaxID=708192 RepID=A0AA37M008_9PEZI|nr:hypothetical protein ColLi_13975 [Colletotrichum liriopes]